MPKENSPQIKLANLFPEQPKMPETADLVAEDYLYSTDNKKKQIYGVVTVEGKSYNIQINMEQKGNEPVTFQLIVVRENTHPKILTGKVAEGFYNLYLPLAKHQ
ncbi:MAG: hypothetical protein WCP17_00950 [bacterium]